MDPFIGKDQQRGEFRKEFPVLNEFFEILLKNNIFFWLLKYYLIFSKMRKYRYVVLKLFMKIYQQ